MQEERKTKAQTLKVSNAFRSRTVQFDKAEETPQKSEEKWRFLLKNTSDVFLNLDRDGTILFINHTVPGYAVEDTIGKTVYDFIPPEQHKKTRKAIEEVFKTGEVVSFETSVLGPDGRTSWYSTRLCPVKDRNKVVSVAQKSTDITERKKAEDELKESEQRFRAIFDNAADGMLLTDLESKKFQAANKTICQMLGYSLEEIKNLGVMDIHPKEGIPYVLKQFEKQATGEFTLAKDIPVERKDGSVFYADINSLPITLDGKTYLMGVFRGITEHRKALEALQAAEKKYRDLVEEMTDVIYTLDIEGNVTSVNKAGKATFGREPKEVLGKS
nr:PAS domain S-box protein [Candidatus Aenigmarchaeota archaeon]